MFTDRGFNDLCMSVISVRNKNKCSQIAQMLMSKLGTSRETMEAVKNPYLTIPLAITDTLPHLLAVIDYYDNPDTVVPDPDNRGPLLAEPLHLSEQDKRDMEIFLQSLTSRSLVSR